MKIQKKKFWGGGVGGSVGQWEGSGFLGGQGGYE